MKLFVVGEEFHLCWEFWYSHPFFFQKKKKKRNRINHKSSSESCLQVATNRYIDCLQNISNLNHKLLLLLKNTNENFLNNQTATTRNKDVKGVRLSISRLQIHRPSYWNWIDGIYVRRMIRIGCHLRLYFDFFDLLWSIEDSLWSTHQ